MKTTQLWILAGALVGVAPVLAADGDEFRSTGSVTIGGIFTDPSGSDLSKFREYQDLRDGVLSNIQFIGRDGRSWIEGYGENFCRDDMYVNIRGGMYDVFKARAYTSWLTHNFLFNGLTPFTGSGTPDLRATFPAPNPANWQPLTLGYDRKDSGGSFEWQGGAPWYVRLDANQVRTQGTKVGSGSNGLSPGNGFTDLAIPVQHETRNVTGEIGYATRTMTLSASYLASNFDNSNELVSWNNGFFSNGIDRSYLAPSNDYQRISLNGTWRRLPLNSTLAVRYTWDEAKSDATIGTSVLTTPPTGTTGPFFGATDPSSPTFRGEHERQTFTLGWAANPLGGLDTRMYVNWQKMKNNSTHIHFADGGENELWHYRKENAGIDAHYRINRGNRIGGGYDYNRITQNRFDFDDTKSDTLWAEWRNTSLETVTARIKYSHLNRRSNFLLGNAGASANDPLYMERFVRAFDLAKLDQNRVKLTLDWAPKDYMGVALEYSWKDNEYGDTTLGRTKDTRHEIFANLTYGTPSTWRVTLFADYETIKYDSFHRYVGVGSRTNSCFDPATAPVSNAYNWSANLDNENWLIGVGVDFPVNERLTLTGSFIYDQADATSDMTAQNNFGNPLPLTQYPNVKTISLNLKGVYQFNKTWSMTAGYAYQKYKYSDDQFNGYVYTGIPPTAAAPQQSYLNGWNAFQPYDANIFYVLGTFRF